MFRILSTDIYEGDRYVFLRELLQNSIDAIRTRRARHDQRVKSTAKRKQAGPTFDTTIYFTIQHQDNGDIIVSCRDYGVGMDEHVIRNYFAIAGVSYYRSEEFDRQHLGFEPVSRFGIGILSCFMVADSLDVKTFRDPECGPAMAYTDSQLPGAEEHRARPLHLTIPAVGRHFIVKDMRESFDVGTEVILTARKKKARATSALSERKDDGLAGKDSFDRILEISEYLCKIAGFVEFPILVNESWPGLDQPKLTLILHPDHDASKEKEQFEEDVTVQQLSREYPWEDFSAPESLDTVRELMTTHRFDLRELLGDKGYEGWIAIPGPHDEGWDYGDQKAGDGTALLTYLHKWAETATEQATVQWTHEVPKTVHSFGAYRDGILLRDIRLPDRYRHGQFEQCPIWMHINLSSAEAPHPNAGRTTLRTGHRSWESTILDAVDEHLRERRLVSVLAMPATERLFAIGWLLSVFALPIKALFPDASDAALPTIWLNSNSELVVREGALPSDEEIPQLPPSSEPLFNELICELWNLPHDSTVNVKWNGPTSIGPPPSSTFGAPIMYSRPTNAILRCLSGQNRDLLSEVRLQFLEPVVHQSSLISQYVYFAHPSED